MWQAVKENFTSFQVRNGKYGFEWKCELLMMCIQMNFQFILLWKQGK